MLKSGNIDSNLALKKIKLELFLSSISTRISSFKILEELIQLEIEVIGNKSSDTVNKLNKFREQLLETNKDLEKIKTKIVEFKHYEGKVKNSLCKNTEHDKKEECETFLINT